MKMKRPEKPVEYSKENWKTEQDYEMAMQAYYNALAIYEMLEETKNENT